MKWARPGTKRSLVDSMFVLLVLVGSQLRVAEFLQSTCELTARFRGQFRTAIDSGPPKRLNITDFARPNEANNWQMAQFSRQVNEVKGMGLGVCV